METKDLLEKVLKDCRKRCGIESVMIGNRDGILIAGEIPSNFSAESLLATISTIFGAAEMVSVALGSGLPNKVVIDTEKGKIIVIGAGPKAFITAKVEPDEEQLGLALFEINRAAIKIKEILE